MTENTLQKELQIGPGTERAEVTPAAPGNGPAAVTPRRRKRKYKTRARACKWCGVSFTPTNRTAEYCCGNHRMAAHRARLRRKPRPAPAPLELVESSCEFCRRSFLVPKPRFSTQKYCSVRCRGRAQRARKRAAPQALAAALGIDAGHTFDVVENAGLALVTGALAAFGWRWNGRDFTYAVDVDPLTMPAAMLPADLIARLQTTLQELSL